MKAMDKNEINKGEILIAEFVGKSELIMTQKGAIRLYCKVGSETPNCELHDLKYHSDWNWLMPVVEKIQSIDISPAPNYRGYRIEIVVKGYVKISGFPMPVITKNVSIEKGLINAIFAAVVAFIEWYNQQKTQQP